MAGLTADQVASLEDLRRRLSALSRNLLTLHSQFNAATRSDDLQGPFKTVASSLHELTRELSKHDDLLSRTVVFPNANYPANTASGVSEHLLATHLGLATQEWIERGQQGAKEASSAGVLSDTDRDRLWANAPRLALDEARKQRWGADYTLAEVQAGVENVTTGLRRTLVVPEDDDDEEFDEESEDDADDDVDADEDSEAMDVDSATAQTKTAATTAPSAPTMPPMDLLDLVAFTETGKTMNAALKSRLQPQNKR
ncbi:Mediator of RNA polymerase II transcription subunit 8 [Cyphellophora attinorum]|uniref:Mediator of RNA polymerase II transcription subunit 8 n=1 Tax=Cyphellophora attinorum TaxID=1664694 RepID=A0A0N1P0V5_9EURO|nr:Mediator of RNA polymerase II transcription subunit 8 [Phialophora attinorum]KPI39644.1 Mediator of RNA polymerase II transcription subunit 8 [Phialophora attinorum]